MLPIFLWSWNFWEMPSLVSFLKNFSYMKRWWREKLQLPVTIKRSFSSKNGKNCSRYIAASNPSEANYLLRYFMFKIIFSKWIWFANSFNCFSDINVWPPGQSAEMRERIASESLEKTRTKFYNIAGHVWVELKL